MNGLSERAPGIVIVTLCAALVASWISAPEWLARGAAIVVAGLAVLLLAGKKRRRPFEALGEEGSADEKGWVAYELAGKGTPPGSYLLGFFGLLTVALTGFNSAYAMLAWAGFALGAVWGIVNAQYPTEDETEH
ncbi:MAG: hypothetical protein ABIW03_00245 [Sphingomicrobium sp.]